MLSQQRTRPGLNLGLVAGLAASAVAWGLAGGVAAAPAAAAGQSPVILDCGYFPKVKPAQYSPGCAGGSPLVRKLRWRGWGTPGARATGTGLLNPCDPSCAEARIVRYPARIVATRIRGCQLDEGPARVYTRLRLSFRYPAGNPFGRPAGWRAFGVVKATCNT